MHTTYHEKDLKWDRGLYHTPDGHFLIDAFGQYCLIEGAEKAHEIRMCRRYTIIMSFVLAVVGIGLQLGYGHSLLYDNGELIWPMIAAFLLYLGAFLSFLSFNVWARIKLPKANVEPAPLSESLLIEARKGTVQEWLILSAWSLLFVLFLLMTTHDLIAASIFAMVGIYCGLSAWLHYRHTKD